MIHSSSIRRTGTVLAAVTAAAVFACTAPRLSLADSGPGRQKSVPPAAPAWSTINVELPISDIEFPPGADADLANVQCLICHSAGMVLRQPPLTKDQWRAEVVKMRAVFGALVPADQVEALTEYLYRINGR